LLSVNINVDLIFRDEVIRTEQLKIKDGFASRSDGTGIVRLVDSKEAIDTLLKPFMENPTTEFFGMDAEWDSSFIGESGTVCLIQMTSEEGTMLVDVRTLRAVHKWTDE
jgi:ribonuclease D